MLGDVDDVVGVHVERGRADELGPPDLLKLAVLVEDLDAIVKQALDAVKSATQEPTA